VQQLSTEIETERMPSVEEALAAALTAGEVRPSTWLECLFYSAEADLMAITRAAAVLDAEGRRDVLDYIQRVGTSAKLS
jgi:hypothetical protein